MEINVSKTPGLFVRFIRAAATRIANDPRVPPENREALAHAAEHVMWQQWRDLVGGDRWKVFSAPEQDPRAREERARRVAASIAAGEPATVIAKREHLRPATVRKQAQRLRLRDR